MTPAAVAFVDRVQPATLRHRCDQGRVPRPRRQGDEGCPQGRLPGPPGDRRGALMIYQDPLCRRHANGWPADRCESCRALRTARLQGPITPGPHHAPLCWCNRCLEASNAIHGVAE